MPRSSWSTMWQWQAVRPAKRSNATRTVKLQRAEPLWTSCRVTDVDRVTVLFDKLHRPDVQVERVVYGVLALGERLGLPNCLG